ncbi:hypothetical protein L596_028531 [Steinernema carpocapsae]|uniref:7TM GPCR serpentine receptor class x (Srx) domain-containing protein n=1 Tax=Steinernema carpocapsae TaxID=34508 RepID=A0A4U5LYP5_STECR|nr:hypothetical protein L596_028531 [Steinernema carpocapsae]
MSSSAYRIMFQLGITGSLQVFFHAIGGFFSLANSSINPYFQMICGGILNAAWIAGIPFTLLLALNRILVICFTSRVGFWFSKRNTSLLIIVFWIYPVLFLIVYVTPFCSIRYNPQQFSWGYDDGPWSYVLSEAEFYSIIAMLVITAFCYILIIIRLVLLVSGSLNFNFNLIFFSAKKRLMCRTLVMKPASSSKPFSSSASTSSASSLGTRILISSPILGGLFSWSTRFGF